RSHGVSSDYVLGATVVTASGAVVDASPAGDADLYWALRGGKGGFGVVAEVRVRLVALPELYAGALTFDTPHVETALRGWMQWTGDAPADVTTSVVLIRYPDLEFLPPHLRGRFLLNLRFAYPGAAAEGERLAAGLRALAPVDVDDVGPMVLTDVARIHSDPTEPGPAWGWGALLTTIDDDFATALTSAFHPAAPVPFLAIEVRHLGGAATTDVDGGSAVGGREGAFAIHVVGAPDPALFAEVLPRAASGFAAEIAPWVAPFTTINYSARFADAAEFARAWPASTFERLAAVRRRVDPHGVFAYGVT
uniref:FAD-binding oxidoreductase n=1 Tax=Pseudolysinimonas sp. TaxID=2680009 RepID=UPI00286B6B1B